MIPLELTPGLLHKDHDADVLLTAANPVIPAYLTIKEWADYSETADAQTLHALQHYYRSCDGIYALNGIPFTLYHTELSCFDDEFELDISQFYQKTEQGWQLTSRYIPLSVTKLLQGKGDSKATSPIPVNEGIALQALFASHPESAIAPVTGYIANIDTDNYFFYRKTHEHVPGLMLIEMARQAMYHYVYSSSGYQRGDISISMNNLNVAFSQYVISPYELEILVSNTQGISRHRPKTVDKTATFYQHGRAVASIRLEGTVMGMKLFKRFRNLTFPRHHWFSVSDHLLPMAVLTDTNGQCCTVRLTSVSSEGIRVDTNPYKEYSAISIGISAQRLLVLPVKKHGQPHADYCELTLGKLTKKQRYDFYEFIKCNTTLSSSNLTQEYSGQADLSEPEEAEV